MQLPIIPSWYNPVLSFKIFSSYVKCMKYHCELLKYVDAFELNEISLEVCSIVKIWYARMMEQPFSG